MKENDGRGLRQRRLFRLMIWVVLIFTVYEIFISHFGGLFIPDIEIDKTTGQKRVRRRPERMKKLVNGELVPKTPLDGVVDGHLQLIDIDIPPGVLLPDGTSSTKYANIQATFCAVDWGLQIKDPTKVALFNDLVQKSQMCEVTKFTADLYDVVQQAQISDQLHRNATQQQWPPAAKQGEYVERYIPPSAVVFHESRSGSTLVSNLLAAAVLEEPPVQSKVYSEAWPPIKALEACKFEEQQRRQNCDRDKQMQLIRDVFYLMGRIAVNAKQRGSKDSRVFYKLQSFGVEHIDLLEEALPKTPWMYIFRDSTEVMMSNMKGSAIDLNDPSANRPQCLERYKRHDKQPKVLQDVVTSHARTIESLTPEEYCAAHLTSLTESAIRQYQREKTQQTQNREGNDKRFFINYNQLPDIIWDRVLPELGVSMTAKRIKRMEQAAALYTKGRSGSIARPLTTVFQGDGEHKNKDVPFEIAQAVATFMDDTYNKVEALATAS